MAQLNSSVVQGSLRVTDTTYTTDLIISNTTAPTIATNDYLLLADASDNNKILKGPVLNTSNTTQWLTQAGTWTTPTKANIGLDKVENTALSTWTGTNKITTVGTITTGTWQGTAIAAAYIGNHSTDKLTSGTLPVGRGGTGIATASYKNAIIAGNASTVTNAFQAIRTNNGAFYATAQDGAPSFGTLPIAQGGTGLTASPSMLTDLSSTDAANILQASPRPGVTGTLGIANGGTGTTGQADHMILIGTGTSLGWRVLDGSDLTTAIQYQADAPASANVVPGTIWLRPTSVSIEDLKCLVVQLNSISGDGSQQVSATYNSNSINQHMVVVGYSISNPAAVVGDLTWTTADIDPTLTVRGYINGNTNIILYLLPERGA